MDKNNQKIYGLLAKFDTPEKLVTASNRVYEAGYRNVDTYTPYPVEGLDEGMHLRPSLMPYIMFIGGLFGAVGAFAMMTYATIADNPYNVGGRPLFSWPSYIPITFELMVLLSGLFGFFGVFMINRLPQPYHPVFNSEDFNEHGAQDAFYLDIQANDPKFDLERTRQFLESLGSSMVSEIEA